jgi:hypothetical protein
VQFARDLDKLFTVRKADALLFVISTEVLQLKIYWAEEQA